LTTNLPAIPIQDQEWYLALVDECQAIFVEGIFDAKMTLIETYHGVGSCILAEIANFERADMYGQNIVQDLARSIGKSTRTVHYAIALATAYPDLNDLPEGKNISMNKLITKYLTAPKDTPPQPVTYYNGLGQLDGGPHRWIVRLPVGEQLDAQVGDSVHVIIKERP